MTLEELRKYRDRIIEIAKNHGATNLRVFGSVARGEADENSDVDLLVDFQQGTGFLKWAELIHLLSEFLGRKVDVVSSKGLRDRIKDRVLREARPL